MFNWHEAKGRKFARRAGRPWQACRTSAGNDILMTALPGFLRARANAPSAMSSPRVEEIRRGSAEL
jgi:hypothetical protein